MMCLDPGTLASHPFFLAFDENPVDLIAADRAILFSHGLRFLADHGLKLFP
jgi:hypothetical protein